MNTNTVENLHKTKIVIAQYDSDHIYIESSEGHYLASLPYCPEDDEPDIEQDFKDQAEALKAAALFRASYEMQQALKEITTFCTKEFAETYGGFLPQWEKCVAALELSENLK